MKSFAAFACAVLFCVFLATPGCDPRDPIVGVVTGTSHKPSQIVMVPIVSGRVITVVPSRTSERWYIHVRSEDGVDHKIEVTQTEYADAVVGEGVRFEWGDQ